MQQKLPSSSVSHRQVRAGIPASALPAPTRLDSQSSIRTAKHYSIVMPADAASMRSLKGYADTGFGADSLSKLANVLWNAPGQGVRLMLPTQLLICECGGSTRPMGIFIR